MSAETVISERAAVPVRIGAMVMYCEDFRAAGTRVFAEKPTVNGDTFFSNTAKKSLRLTFEGRVYDTYLPLRFLHSSDALMFSDAVFTVSYRGLVFSGCHVQSFEVKDSGADYINGSITLVTCDSVQLEEAE